MFRSIDTVTLESPQTEMLYDHLNSECMDSVLTQKCDGFTDKVSVWKKSSHRKKKGSPTQLVHGVLKQINSRFTYIVSVCRESSHRNAVYLLTQTLYEDIPQTERRMKDM